jgi:hypothetical protein
MTETYTNQCSESVNISYGSRIHGSVILSYGCESDLDIDVPTGKNVVKYVPSYKH